MRSASCLSNDTEQFYNSPFLTADFVTKIGTRQSSSRLKFCCCSTLFYIIFCQCNIMYTRNGELPFQHVPPSLSIVVVDHHMLLLPFDDNDSVQPRRRHRICSSISTSMQYTNPPFRTSNANNYYCYYNHYTTLWWWLRRRSFLFG